jgi:uncharacterized protein (UPF0297 family)
MRKKITYIREMAIIENEFSTTRIGILAFKDNKEKVNQIVGPFIYADKNIYIFFDENDENFDKIEFDEYVSFIITKSGEISATSEPLKYAFSKASGFIKKIEEIKVIEEISKAFVKKYYDQSENIDLRTKRLVMIDTEEIQAVEASNL